MPTFNQLVRKGRQTSVKKSTAPGSSEVTILLRRSLLRHLLHRSVVYVQLVKTVPLKA